MFFPRTYIRNQSWSLHKKVKGQPRVSHHLNKLNRPYVPYAVCQVSTKSAYWFQRRRILKCLAHLSQMLTSKLIVYRLSVARPHFQTWISLRLVSQSCVVSLVYGKICETLFSMATKRSHWCCPEDSDFIFYRIFEAIADYSLRSYSLGENVVRRITSLFLNGSSSNKLSAKTEFNSDQTIHIRVTFPLNAKHRRWHCPEHSIFSLIGSLWDLKPIWTGITSRKSSNSGHIGTLTLELLAL